jgi:hypothetical protein
MRALHDRASEALTLVEVSVHPDHRPSGVTKRRINQIEHALETARVALRRAIQLTLSR